MADTGYGKDVNVLWKDRKRWCGLPLSFTRYKIIEKPTKWLKLIVDKGFLSRHVEEINMFRIEDVSVVETFTNRLWGTGSITVLAKDASHPETILVRVAHPKRIRNMITELVEQDRKSKNVSVGEMHI
ncbi:MAG: PH domain-containing protein [Clostridia bacterium]|nr:PH domain-containing protein [Clostridia bacterium]